MTAKKWNNIPTRKVVDSTAEAIRGRGMNVQIVNTKQEAMDAVKSLIPSGGEIAKGSSTTLEEIGFFDYINSEECTWVDLYREAWSEEDGDKRHYMLTKANSSDYFVGSVNAVSQNGELVAVGGSGAGISSYPFSAKHLILAVGTHKITKDLEEGMRRVREHFFPMENKRIKHKYGLSHKAGKWVIIENEVRKDRTTVILIHEKVGF
jgi:hypothetical protein